jgi:hypothetical protein
MRSSSCPDDAVRRSAVTDDDIFHSQPRSSSLRQPNWLAPVPGSEWMTFNPTRPLSPIFSPLEATTPTSVVTPREYTEASPATPQQPAKAESIISVSPIAVPSRKVCLINSRHITNLIPISLCDHHLGDLHQRHLLYPILFRVGQECHPLVTVIERESHPIAGPTPPNYLSAFRSLFPRNTCLCSPYSSIFPRVF